MTTVAASRSPTLSEVLRTSVDYFLQDLYSALPGRIDVYDAATQKADIKPLIKRLIASESGEEIVEELPILPQVPIVFPRGGGGFFMTFPLKPGDLVLLVFNQRSIDKYIAGPGEDTNPDDFVIHDISDAVAIPGFYPDSKALKDIDSDDLVMGFDGGVSIHLNKEGVINLGSKAAADALALASKVNSNVDALQAAHDSHTHLTTATVGPTPVVGIISPTAAPVGPLPIVDSDVVKSD